MQDLNYIVYWIHYPHQTNPYTEGYIGITNNVERRLSEHKTTNPHMKNRINKGAVCDILCKYLDRISACNIELNFRPSENVGWNVALGGSIPPSRKGKKNNVVRRGNDCTVGQKRAHAEHSERMMGNIPANAISTLLFGSVYPSISAACRCSDITYEQYLYWLDHQYIQTADQLKKSIVSDKNTSISKTRILSSKVKRGTYYITDPNGVSHVVSNGIVDWCRVRGINPSNLRKLGKSKGYSCVYKGDVQ